MGNWQLRFWIGSLLTVSVGLLGCGAARDDSSPSGGTPVAPQVADDWIGYQLGADPGDWYDMGEVRLGQAALGDPSAPGAPAATGTAFVETTRLSIVDLEARRHFQYQPDPASQHQVARWFEARGAGAPDFGEEPPDADTGSLAFAVEQDSALKADQEQGLVNKGWSDRIDNRIPRGIGDGGYTQSTWPYRTIGFVKTIDATSWDDDFGCSGAFVGDKAYNYFVLTTAHCLWNANGSPVPSSFEPRRDRADTPYGSWVANRYYTYAAWLNNECYNPTNGNTNDCRKHDIALMRVSRPSGKIFPGHLGYAAKTNSQLNQLAKYSRAYPLCILPGAPSSCSSHTLYGDTNQCVLAGPSHPDSDGYDRLILHSCDSSGGQSGAPLYYTGSIAFAVEVSGFNCFGPGTPLCSDPATPNRLRRITPSWSDLMTGWINE